jgi:hypothetical protein
MKKTRPKKTRKGAKDERIETVDRDVLTGYPMFVGA